MVAIALPVYGPMDGVFYRSAVGEGGNPKTAVWEYLKAHDELEVDKIVEQKLLITVAPDGCLKRIK